MIPLEDRRLKYKEGGESPTGAEKKLKDTHTFPGGQRPRTIIGGTLRLSNPGPRGGRGGGAPCPKKSPQKGRGGDPSFNVKHQKLGPTEDNSSHGEGDRGKGGGDAINWRWPQ